MRRKVARYKWRSRLTQLMSVRQWATRSAEEQRSEERHSKQVHLRSCREAPYQSVSEWWCPGTVGLWRQSERPWRSWEQRWRNRTPEVACWAPSEVGREELHQNHQCLSRYPRHPIRPKIAQGKS